VIFFFYVNLIYNLNNQLFMKKVFLIVSIVLLGFGNVNAQETKYGITSGFHRLTISSSALGLTLSQNASGFFVGFFADFNFSEKFNIQPEIHFASTYNEGESANEIIIPVMAKYMVSEKFNLQVGPQFDFITEESEGLNKFGVGLGFGFGYDFSDKLFVASRYSLGLTNRIQDASEDFSSKFNTFQIGLGYRF
jgi:opacity protein-like surface antigen